MTHCNLSLPMARAAELQFGPTKDDHRPWIDNG